MKQCLNSCALALVLWTFQAAAQAPAPSDSTHPRQPGEYQLGPDSYPQDGVPRGKVEGPFTLKSQIFTHTVRRYWIYVPAQYNKTKPACVMVFQDGQNYVRTNGALRVPIVMDNLIAKKEMPVTIGIFITPGQRGDEYEEGKGKNPSNRSFEYDSLTDEYAHFICEEILPKVGKTYNLTKDPDGRAIGGLSSGAICAFTVAWQRPSEFHKVLSMIGSYTSIAFRPAHDDQPMIPGGDIYPTLIRKNPVKPLRIFFQDGSNDLNNEHGNWFLANQQMVSALEFANARAEREHATTARYAIKTEWGDGNHSDVHGGSIMPEMLRWLWQDYPK